MEEILNHAVVGSAVTAGDHFAKVIGVFPAAVTFDHFNRTVFHVGFEHSVGSDDAHLSGTSRCQDVHGVGGPDIVFIVDDGDSVVEGIFFCVKETQVRRLAAIFFRGHSNFFPDLFPFAGLSGKDVEEIGTFMLNLAMPALLGPLRVGFVVR